MCKAEKYSKLDLQKKFFLSAKSEKREIEKNVKK